MAGSSNVAAQVLDPVRNPAPLGRAHLIGGDLHDPLTQGAAVAFGVLIVTADPDHPELCRQQVGPQQVGKRRHQEAARQIAGGA